jgi:hypothetical protein
MKAVPLDFDVSNQSSYGWVALIKYKVRSVHTKQEWVTTKLDTFLFPTLGHAQAFYKPFVGDWKQDAPGGKWKADFKNRLAYKNAIEVQLEQMLYMGDDQCVSAESLVPIGEKP